MLAKVREAWQPLRSQWLGEVVLLSVDDRVLKGVALRRGAISTPAWETMLPAQALVQGMPELPDVLGDFIGDLLLSQGLIAQAVRVALPMQAAHWRVITWPLESWPDDPIEALRTIDPDLGLPFDLAEAAIDVQPLPGRPLRSLLVAAPRQLVEAWSTVFELAGSPLERLVPTQVCLRQALLPRFKALDPRDGVMLLHPEQQTCTVTLWQQGVPLYERMLPLESPDLGSNLAEILAYFQTQEPGFCAKQLWLTAPLSQQQSLARTLQLPLELLDSAVYDSPVLQGLAQSR